MSAPPRLTEDPSISDALRSDLRTAAQAESRPYDASRGLESLRAAIGGLPVPSAPPPTTGLGPTFWGVTGVGSAIVIGAILAGGYYFYGEPESAAAPTQSAPRLASAPDEVVVADEVPPAASAPAAIEPIAGPIAGPIADEPRASSVAPRRARPAQPIAVVEAAPAPVADAPVEPAVDPDALLRLEMTQLAQIRRLLQRDPAEALRLAEDGQRRFGDGMFREEREALAVLSLARLGRPEARTRGRAFLRQHPRGPFSEEIRRLVARP